MNGRVFQPGFTSVPYHPSPIFPPEVPTMKSLVAALAVLASVAAAPNAGAQFARPEDAILYRQAAFQVVRKHFGSLGAMANGKAPFDARAASADAGVLAAVFRLPYTAFGPGTGQGANTKANPQIWQKMDEFQKDTEAHDAAMTRLIAAAQSGDLAQLKAAFGPAARTCKTCHDSFKDR
jgi:cytochrome c556